MVDITHKNSTLRTAVAQATISVSSQETIDKIIQKQIPKGDVFEMAKTAGLFAAKKTSDVIPDCHPLPIEYTKISFEIIGLEIIIQTEIHTIYKTGVEVEAMYAASVVAITMYDMLKPVDKSIEVSSIKLIQKTGGKTDYQKIASQVKIGVIVCSDSISAGEKTDRSGKIIMEKMKAFEAEIVDYKVIPDEIQQIQEHINAMESAGCNLILITGGTGLSPKDVTPEAIKPLLDKEIPGIVEAIRSYGQQRTPYSMLSRSVAGFKNDMLVIALPGSTNGVSESIDAVFPALFHVFRVRNHFKHNEE